MGKKEMVKKEKKAILEDQLLQQQTVYNVEKEIYENISQCLCLARFQLGSINFESKEKMFAIIGEANLLIGKAVKDLRNLAKQLSLPNKNHY